MIVEIIVRTVHQEQQHKYRALIERSRHLAVPGVRPAPFRRLRRLLLVGPAAARHGGRLLRPTPPSREPGTAEIEALT